ncbi:SPW repeat protein [Terrarubrum flagellatum]|uniref:SPW repeat protein n=1 Tax=Terrirubrum flagellatum TaxID=2895980 RepID=UPI0031450EC8
MSMTENRRPQDWVNLLLAVCLFLSPWVMGFAGDVAPARNAWIVAVALAVIAIAALAAFAEWEEWLNVLLGAWLVVSPWLLGFTAAAPILWTHVIFGALIIIASGWAVWDNRHTPHTA